MPLRICRVPGKVEARWPASMLCPYGSDECLELYGNGMPYLKFPIGIWLPTTHNRTYETEYLASSSEQAGSTRENPSAHPPSPGGPSR